MTKDNPPKDYYSQSRYFRAANLYQDQEPEQSLDPVDAEQIQVEAKVAESLAEMKERVDAEFDKTLEEWRTFSKNEYAPDAWIDNEAPYEFSSASSDSSEAEEESQFMRGATFWEKVRTVIRDL